MSGIPDDIGKDAEKYATMVATVFPLPSDSDQAIASHGHSKQIVADLIAKAIHAERQRCEDLARRYSVGYEKALGMYGSADKDSGRGRQEGHINAGREIADLIRISASLPAAPKGEA